MLKLLQSIFGQTPAPATGHDEKLIELATERVIDGTDPRLRALSGYRRKLRSAVVEALNYTIELVDDLPEPTVLSRKQFSHDDYIRSFFVSTDHINEFLTQSRILQDFLEKRTGLDPLNVYALLALTRVERQVMGMKMDGEILRRDVAQVSVSFSKPRLSAPMDDEAACRFEIKKDVFDYFVQLALKDLVAAREKRQKSTQKPDILGSKLHTLESSNWGIESLLAGETERAVDTEKTEQQLLQLESELKQRETTPLSLENYLDIIVSTLSSVRDRLWKESVTVGINRMGIKAEQDSGDAVVMLHLSEYCSADGRRIIALPVSIPFDQIPARPDFLAEASRYL